MKGASVEASGRSRRSLSASGFGRTPAGFKILVPGYAQWSWRQRERGLVLLGSFLAALAVAVFAWGTPMGAAVLFFAFGTHVISTVDVIRQAAFPGFGRWMPLCSTSGGLAVGLYLPALVVASAVAWPASDSREGNAEGYLVNCWAYHDEAPKAGDWVWLKSSPAGLPRVGRVVAAPGQGVEWSGNRMAIDGSKAIEGAPFQSRAAPDQLSFIVPGGHVLVAPEAGSNRRLSRGLVLVPRDKIAGRAWAQMYPVWERQLLR